MGTINKVHEGNPRLHYYNNTLDYYTLDTNPLQMQCECNDVAFEEFTKHTTKMKPIHPKFKINDVVESCCRSGALPTRWPSRSFQAAPRSTTFNRRHHKGWTKVAVILLTGVGLIRRSRAPQLLSLNPQGRAHVCRCAQGWGLQ
jgi:hypothetical protein